MWTSLSAGRWTCLLTLAGVMLVSASQETFKNLPCCYGGSSHVRKPVERDCFIQEPRKGCHTPAYLVKPVGHIWHCIKQDSRWIQMMMQKNKVKCRPELSKPHHRSEVLARMYAA